MSTPRKRKVLTFDVKAKLIADVMNGEENKTVSERLDIPQSTLSTILDLKATITSAASTDGPSSDREKVKSAT